MNTRTRKAVALVLSLSLALGAALGLELSAGGKTIPPSPAALGLKAPPMVVEQPADGQLARGLKAPPLT